MQTQYVTITNLNHIMIRLETLTLPLYNLSLFNSGEEVSHHHGPIANTNRDIYTLTRTT